MTNLELVGGWVAERVRETGRHANKVDNAYTAGTLLGDLCVAYARALRDSAATLNESWKRLSAEVMAKHGEEAAPTDREVRRGE